jgi:RNA polymerase sigma factor (sigma-70 family)
VRANLRLVVSIARKHLRPNVSLMELISDGNLTLMRAVESFDTHKGNRFSTYATLALMKGFARSVPLMQAQHAGVSRLVAGTRRENLQPEMPDTRIEPASRRVAVRDEVEALFARLDRRERAVLAAHFGIADTLSGGDSTESLAERFGLSTQRLRQIERTALEKLRAIAKA